MKKAQNKEFNRKHNVDGNIEIVACREKNLIKYKWSDFRVYIKKAEKLYIEFQSATGTVPDAF